MPPFLSLPPAEQILAGFVSEGDAVVIDAAPGGGVTLETVPAGEALPDVRASVPGTEAPDVPMALGGEA